MFVNVFRFGESFNFLVVQSFISAWAGYSSKKEHTLVCVLRIIKHESLIAFSLYVSLLEGNEF